MSDLDSYKDSMRRFRLAKYMLEIESGKDGLDLPTYKGSTFRGGFGHAFRSMVCTMKKTDCTDCLLKEQCPYSYIFETSPGHRSEVLNNFEEVPRPYVIEPPPEKKTFYKPGEKIRFELILIGKAIEYLPYFLVTFVELGNMGIGRGRKPYVLRRVLGQNPFKKVEHLIYSDEDKKVRNCDITITGEDILNQADNGVHSMEMINYTNTEGKYWRVKNIFQYTHDLGIFCYILYSGGDFIMKKIVLVIILLALLMVSMPAVYATDISVYIDGSRYFFNPGPITQSGTTLVPMRQLFEVLGADVRWDEPSKTIIAKRDNTTIILKINSTTAYVNGDIYSLTIPPKLIRGITYIPLRFVGESLGDMIDYDDVNNSIIINRIHKDPANLMNEEKPEQKKLSTQEIVQTILPTTVMITTNRGQGSGFFVSEDGLVMTSAHVVRGSEWINVEVASGQKYDARIYKIENSLDAALLKIKADGKVPFIKQYRRYQDIEVGEEIIVFGNPLSLKDTVTKGIISAKRLDTISKIWTNKVYIIQFDATAAPGSSGGAIVDEKGAWIGIVQGGLPEKDLNFAIASDCYEYLMNYRKEYDLADDWFCYITEDVIWQDRLNTIRKTDISISALDSINNIILPGLKQLVDEVSSYSPQFYEVKKIRDKFLKCLQADIIMWSYMEMGYLRPLSFSRTKSKELLDETLKLYNEYYNMVLQMNDKAIKLRKADQ